MNLDRDSHFDPPFYGILVQDSTAPSHISHRLAEIVWLRPASFFEDISDPNRLAEALENVLDALMERVERSGSAGRTVTLKVKFADFRQITRARSFTAVINDRARIGAAGQGLLAALCPVPLGVRLLGLTLSALVDDEEEEGQPGFDQLALSL